MVEVKFYDEADDRLLKFAVIIAKTDNKWVFCKHRERETYEVPGGHRENGEHIFDTAKRELYEETGALEYSIKPICVYSVTAPDNFDGKESYGCFTLQIFCLLKMNYIVKLKKFSLRNNLWKAGHIR